MRCKVHTACLASIYWLLNNWHHDRRISARSSVAIGTESAANILISNVSLDL